MSALLKYGPLTVRRYSQDGVAYDLVQRVSPDEVLGYLDVPRNSEVWQYWNGHIKGFCVLQNNVVVAVIATEDTRQ